MSKSPNSNKIKEKLVNNLSKIVKSQQQDQFSKKTKKDEYQDYQRMEEEKAKMKKLYLKPKIKGDLNNESMTPHRITGHVIFQQFPTNDAAQTVDQFLYQLQFHMKKDGTKPSAAFCDYESLKSKNPKILLNYLEGRAILQQLPDIQHLL